MSDQRDPNIVATDSGTPAPMPTPAMPSAIQPASTMPQSGAQPSDNSNQPDASTPAAKSIPAALVNNPAVPTQKMAAQADANKNSVSPPHGLLYQKAIEMTGGQRYTTKIDSSTGETVRTPVEPKPWALGLALALDVLSGGIAGGNAKDSIGAAQAGAQVADKQRAAVKQANQEQDTQAQNDMKTKMAVTEANMRTHLLAQQVGASDKAISQTLSDAYKPLTDGLTDGSIPMTNGASVTQPMFEADAMAAIKNGKTNITHDVLFPVGDPQPVMENGVQKIGPNGTPLWGHNYIVVHGADKLQTALTDDLKQKLQSIGYFRNPDGSAVNIGNPQWSFADLSKKMSEYAAVQAGEAMLNQHLGDAHEYLGTADKDIPKLSDLATEVRNDPAMRKAIQTFSRFGGTLPIDVILSHMNDVDPQGAAKIMQYMQLTPKMLGDMATARDAEKKKDAAKQIQPDTDDKARMIANDPTETPVRRKLAQAVLDAKSTEAKSLKLKELQDTRAVQDSDINQAAANLIKNPADTTTLKSISSLKGDERLRLYNKIHELSPNYDTGKVDAKVKVLNDFADGKASDNIVAYNTFLGHALDASEAVNQFRGTGGNVSPLINKGLNWLDKNAANDPTYAAFKTALIPVQKEFMSFLNNNRAEHEADIEDMKTVIDPASTPAQIQATLKKLAQSGDIRLTQLGRKYQNTMGTTYENLYSPEGKAAIMRLTIPSGMTRIQQPSGAYQDVPSANAAIIIKQHPQLKIVGQEQ
jgi:hypothetical protein